MTAFIDPLALLLVVVGSLLLATLQHGWRAARLALALWRADDSPEQEAAAAERLIHAAAAAISHRGLFAAETLAPRHSFLRGALAELADAPSADAFAGRMAALRQRAAAPLSGPVRYWLAVGEAAPALGMIGTVAGMISMAGDLGTAASAGPPLALALTSTLYGLVLSACIAAPLAERAQRRVAAGEQWRQRLSDAFVALVARETGGAG
jgi:chemotaxis protein MotA